MYNFDLKFTYKVNGNLMSSTSLENSDYAIDLSVTDSSIKCILKPKKEMELINFTLNTKRTFEDREVFFVNGIQSWSTSPEVDNKQTLHGVFGIAKLVKPGYHLASVSSDDHFTNYGKKGNFHSFTYTYFRQGGEIELFGSLNEKTGYTIFETDADEKRFSIIKDVEGAQVNGEYELLNVLVIKKAYDDAFDEYFGAMNLRKPKIKHLSGYTSWYNYFRKINENIILRDLDGLDRVKEHVNIFQIDDGYQKAIGEWLETDTKKFPNGMKMFADKIHEKGYLAGIWLAPFFVQKSSIIAKEHPDWLIKDEKGKPMIGSFAWGPTYVFDIYVPEAAAYIKNFFNVILNEWGYDMVKLDFLYSQAYMPRYGKSRGQLMCEGMEFLRECCGEDKLILGCGVPLGPSFGIVDACRISCDVDLKYSGMFYNALKVNRELPSAQNSMNNTIFRRHLNQRAFCNDPDVFFLRDFNLVFTDEQKKILATVNNLFGDVLFVSDDVGRYGEREVELLKGYFAENDSKIISAGYTDENIMTIEYVQDGENKVFSFDMVKGVIIEQ